jgi:preprotein translocase subunit SecG
MVILLTIVHVIVCVFLVIVVLLQSGKAADLAGAFGGMGSQTVFGPRGSATALSRATTLAAALFMITSLTLSVMSSRGGRSAPSVLDKAKKAPAQKPILPGQTAPITVQTETGGQKNPPQVIQVPVQGTPPTGQAPVSPQQQKKQ